MKNKVYKMLVLNTRKLSYARDQEYNLEQNKIRFI